MRRREFITLLGGAEGTRGAGAARRLYSGLFRQLGVLRAVALRSRVLG